MIKNLNFAMTFPPTKDLIINLLRFADGEERSNDELCEYTGMPGGKSSGKLRPHLDYAEAMGLLQYTYQNGKYTVKRTELGEKIYVEDFSLDEDITVQLLNYFMSSNVTGAEIWNLIIRALPVNNVVSLSVLLNRLNTKYDKSEDSATRIIAPFKSAHQGFFKAINFITIKNSDMIVNSMNVNKKYVFMYAYTLLFDWNSLLPNNSEITFEDIRDIIQWGAGFGWSESELFAALQLCEEHGVIKINKQLTPMTVVRNIDEKEALEKVFDLL